MTAPYQRHSRTSKEAAERLETARTLEADILIYLASAIQGLTGDELHQLLESKHIGLQAGTISARLRGLEIKGDIFKTKHTRTTRMNRSANVWKSKVWTSPDEILNETRDDIDAIRRERDEYKQLLGVLMTHYSNQSLAYVEIASMISETLNRWDTYHDK